MRVCPPDPPLSGRKPAQILPVGGIVFSALRQTWFSGEAHDCHIDEFAGFAGTPARLSGGSCCFWVYPPRVIARSEADSRCCVGKAKHPKSLGIAGRSAFLSW